MTENIESKGRHVVSNDLHTGLRVKAFRTGSALAQWLECQATDAPGIWLLLRKKGQRSSKLTRQQAVDAALCHGWIDGQVLPNDDSSYLVRLTPRRKRSLWSQINRERVLVLCKEKRVGQKGLAEMERARKDGRWNSAYAPASTVQVPEDLRAALDAKAAANSHFLQLTKTARYELLHNLETAGTPKTRQRRMDAFIRGAP